MKYTVVLLALFVAMSDSRAQEVSLSPQPTEVSAGKAFALSLVVPGLGHRHVHGGDWDGWASVFATADAALWAGLLGTEWHRDHLVQSYRTMAATRAGADTEGKSRDFFLNLASFISSDEFTAAQLRNRSWDRVDYAADPSFQWAWESEQKFNEYREAREDAESLRRRRTFIVGALVANRLIAGFTALRSARRAGDPQAELSFGAPPRGAAVPLVNFVYRF